MTRAKRKTRKVKEHMKNAADMAMKKAFEILFDAADARRPKKTETLFSLEVVYI
jgi:hypothetical protein